MRKMLLGVTLVVGLFVGGTMSASASGANPQDVVANTPAHERQHGSDVDGLCTAWYAIGGDPGHHPHDH